MIVYDTKIRVRYAETDQAGFVYYGNYGQYYEVARVETFRHMGASYKIMEEKGVFMPVLSMSLKYLKPASYDDLLSVRTIIREIPVTRMRFEYEVRNEQGVLINTGETVLAFVSKATRRPVRAPGWFLDILEKFMKDNG